MGIICDPAGWDNAPPLLALEPKYLVGFELGIAILLNVKELEPILTTSNASALLKGVLLVASCA